MFNLYASWDSYEADEDVATDGDRCVSLASFRPMEIICDNSVPIQLSTQPLTPNIINNNNNNNNHQKSVTEINELNNVKTTTTTTSRDVPQGLSSLPMEKFGSLVPAVKATDVVYSYGKKKKTVNALQGINLTVPQGFIYGLLGPSGCGKTSLLRCVVGRISPKSGEIRVFGTKRGEAGSQVPGAAIGYMPQELALFPDFTLEETLNYFGRLYRMKDSVIAKRSEFLLNFLDLPEKRRLVGNLSGGQKRRVSLAAALVHNPPLLILDEPTVGVDPLLRQSIWDYLVTLSRNESLTVIITTHYIEEARAANIVGLMRFGRILIEQTPKYLLRRFNYPTLEEVFLRVCELDSQGIDLTNQIEREGSVSVVTNNRPDICYDVNKEDSINSTIGSTEAIDSAVEDSDYSVRDNQEDIVKDLTLTDTVINRYADMSTKSNALKDSAARTSALFWKNITRLRRNLAVLLFQFLLPSIEVILFCTCIGQHPFDIPVAVFNQETSGQYATDFLQHIDNKTIVQMPYPSFDSALQAVKDGDAWGALVIGKNFTNALQMRVLMSGEVDNETLEMSNIHLYPDMTNQMISLKLYETITLSFLSFGREMLQKIGQSSSMVELPIVLEKPVYGERTPTFTEFMAPGVVLSIAFLAAVALTALAFVMERKEGLLERSLVAGVSSSEFMLSHVLTQLLVLSVQVALLLIFTFLVFEIPFRGPFIWVIVLTLLQGSCGMAFGLMISAICEEENSATMLALGSFYPNLLLSGTVWPTQAMPEFIRYFSYLLPQTIPIEAMRYILSRGWDPSYKIVALGFGVTIIWITFFLTMAVIIFKYKK
ncbi:ABC transporter G family member 20-like [Oppia nitens]|uniref:ABC transporter G family member 20-like n=1 Tax=Oppia nitens TaxID=1686743 RepID=UPI0023D9AC80|nr:ABC transporter G family member 20-like [Oppia nitens]